METRKVVVKAVKKVSQEQKEHHKKEPRPTTKEGLMEWQKEGKKLTSAEMLFLDGKRFYNFAQKIEFMEKWFDKCKELKVSPNDRLRKLIEKDIAE